MPTPYEPPPGTGRPPPDEDGSSVQAEKPGSLKGGMAASIGGALLSGGGDERQIDMDGYHIEKGLQNVVAWSRNAVRDASVLFKKAAHATRLQHVGVQAASQVL